MSRNAQPCLQVKRRAYRSNFCAWHTLHALDGQSRRLRRPLTEGVDSQQEAPTAKRSSRVRSDLSVCLSVLSCPHQQAAFCPVLCCPVVEAPASWHSTVEERPWPARASHSFLHGRPKASIGSRPTRWLLLADGSENPASFGAGRPGPSPIGQGAHTRPGQQDEDLHHPSRPPPALRSAALSRAPAAPTPSSLQDDDTTRLRSLFLPVRPSALYIPPSQMAIHVPHLSTGPSSRSSSPIAPVVWFALIEGQPLSCSAPRNRL